MKRFLVLGLLLLSPMPLRAQEQAQTIEEEDALFDDAVRQFGYTGGLAWQCSADENKLNIERQALAAYQGLTQLFGTDQAFYFAASYGAGSLVDFDKAACDSHLANFAEGMAKARKAE